MKLTLINQYYPPDLAPTGHLAAGLVTHRRRLGDHVTVVTSAGGYAQARSAEPVSLDSSIHRLWTPKLGRAGLLRRTLDYVAFYLGSTWKMIRHPAQDIVISMTTPPWIGFSGWLHKKLNPRSKLVVWTMDAYPEVAERFGVIQEGGFLSLIGRALSRLLLTSSDHIITLDSAMRDLMDAHYSLSEHGIPVSILPNWEPSALYRGNGAFPLELEENFVVLYMGNAGKGHDFDTVLAAADRLRNEPIAFVFIGGGPAWQALSQAKQAMDLTRMHLLDYVPKEETAAVMAGADLGLITMRDEALGVISPSKLHGYLAMRLPIIYVGPKGSNVDEAIEDFECGASFRHGDLAGLAQFITDLARDSDFRQQMATKAREAFDQRYSDQVALAEFDSILAELGPGT